MAMSHPMKGRDTTTENMPAKGAGRKDRATKAARRTAAAMILVLMPGAQALAGGVKSATDYLEYPVSGDSALAIVQSMLAGGPHYNGGHAYATTEVKVDPDTVQDTSNGCRAADLTLNARFTISLPRHNSRARLSSRVGREYDSLHKVLLEHENKHRQIFLGCLNRMHQRIMALPAADNCAAFSRQVKRITDEEWENCRALNQALDLKDGRRHDTLPLIATALAEANGARRSTAAFGVGKPPAGDTKAPGKVVIEIDPMGR